jgi:hypothetical protein
MMAVKIETFAVVDAVILSGPSQTKIIGCEGELVRGLSGVRVFF